MKLILYFFALICFSVSFLTHAFSYDSAIYAAQKGEIKNADEQLCKLVVNSPDSADVLYDAGAIAYKLDHYDQAAAYFSRAGRCAVDEALRFQAYFNAGNAYVDAKELSTALEFYDKALVLQPDNEYARNNRDRVAQMLQEQKKQQDQQKKEDEKKERDDKDKQNDEEDNQDKQSDGGDDQNDQENNDGNDQQDGNGQQQKNSKNDSSGDQSDQKSQGNKGNDSKHSNEGQQRKEQGDATQKQNESTNKQERNGKQELDKRPQNADSKQEQQHGEQHGKTPDKHDQINDNASVASGAVSEQGKNDSVADWDKKIDDPWLVSVLNEQESRDKAINKKLMEAKVHQHGGKNGQNSW
jgi:Ca-activated chloride channel family protein